eukprot:531142-Pyramimonas_sp.AAC.1
MGRRRRRSRKKEKGGEKRGMRGEGGAETRAGEDRRRGEDAQPLGRGCHLGPQEGPPPGMERLDEAPDWGPKGGHPQQYMHAEAVLGKGGLPP